MTRTTKQGGASSSAFLSPSFGQKEIGEKKIGVWRTREAPIPTACSHDNDAVENVDYKMNLHL